MSSPNFLFVSILLACFSSQVVAQTSQWEGDWITDFGELSTVVENNELTGTLKNRDISGVVKGDKLTLKYEIKQRTRDGDVWKPAEAILELNESGTSFKRSGKGNTFRGWKLNDDLDAAETADFSGHWVSNWGNMVLEQDGDSVTGVYGSQGLASLKGTVKGNRLNLTWNKLHWSGKAFIEQSKDGSRIYGTTYDTKDPTKWIGLKPKEFNHHAEPQAGKIVKGYADNGMLYHLRMPDGWSEGDPVDVIVLFHGSNWTTLGMVAVTARNWPDIGKKFAILGIQGERWADWSNEDDLRHNYTYRNWMGRSTYKGFPYTDRESPSLVMELIEELGDEYSFERTFVGGHSQGGYLSYVIQMHFADQVDGVFPISGEMMIQCEPDVFDDESLMKAQRSTPMVIVHGKKDNAVRFASAEYAYDRLLAHGFGNVKLLAPSLGHGYDFLPINEAIEYLDAATTDDPELLAGYIEKMVSEKDWRTVGYQLLKAREFEDQSPFKSARAKFEEQAAKHIERHLKDINKGVYGKWVDRFHRWQEDFSLAEPAAEVNEAWSKLAATHTETAKELSTKARDAFRASNANEGWELRKKIVLENFASPTYRRLKSGVEKKYGKLYKLVKKRR